MEDLEYEILRGILDELDRLHETSEDAIRLRELREKLQALVLTKRMRSALKPPPPKPKVAWVTVLQWGIAGALIIGALLAQLLGVNVKELLP